MNVLDDIILTYEYGSTEEKTGNELRRLADEYTALEEPNIDDTLALLQLRVLLDINRATQETADTMKNLSIEIQKLLAKVDYKKKEENSVSG